MTQYITFTQTQRNKTSYSTNKNPIDQNSKRALRLSANICLEQKKEKTCVYRRDYHSSSSQSLSSVSSSSPASPSSDSSTKFLTSHMSTAPNKPHAQFFKDFHTTIGDEQQRPFVSETDRPDAHTHVHTGLGLAQKSYPTNHYVVILCVCIEIRSKKIRRPMG